MRRSVVLIMFASLAAYACGSPTQPTASSIGFTATPTSVLLGSTSTLTWNTVPGVTSCSIDNGVGVVTCTSGSRAVAPMITTTYTFTASGTTGATTATATVTVTGASPTSTPTPAGSITPVTPTIGTFTASPASVQAGGTTTLSWSGIVNADHCLINNDVGVVSCADTSVTVAPPGSSTASFVVPYTLTAVGIQASVTSTVNVTVTPR